MVYEKKYKRMLIIKFLLAKISSYRRVTVCQKSRSGPGYSRKFNLRRSPSSINIHNYKQQHPPHRYFIQHKH